jgi:LacI family transcriptional regulator
MAVHKYRLDSREEWIASGDVTSEGGYEAMRRIFESGQLPTAVFASNDAMALGAMKFLREKGVQIPQQVSIAGFDDIYPAEHVTPSLTTVHVDKIKMGELVAQRLIARLHDSRLPIEKSVVPNTLIVRESTGGPRCS